MHPLNKCAKQRKGENGGSLPTGMWASHTSQRAWMTRSARLSLGVACRFTMTRRPPALAVRSGRLQAGVIWRLVPRHSATPAALACTLAASNSGSGSASSLPRANQHAAAKAMPYVHAQGLIWTMQLIDYTATALESMGFIQGPFQMTVGYAPVLICWHAGPYQQLPAAVPWAATAIHKQASQQTPGDPSLRAPVQNEVLQAAPTAVALAARVFEADAVHLEVAHVLALAAAAALREAVAVQLREPGARQAAAQVQAVYVLTHRVPQLARPVQRHQRLRTGAGREV